MCVPTERQYLSFRICSEACDQREVRATIEVRAEDEIFREHFPEQPILPGAFMASLAIDIVMRSFAPGLESPVRIEQISFSRPVRPGDRLLFFARQVEPAADPGKFAFVICNPTLVSCRGKVTFADAGDRP